MIDCRVIISGVGVVSSYGIGKDLFWEGLRQGESTSQLISSFDASRLPTRFAAPVSIPDTDLLARIENRKALKTMSRAGRFALVAANEAVAQARLEGKHIDPYRFGTSLGTGGLGLADLDHVASMLQIIEDSIDANNGSLHLDQGTYFYNKLRHINPLTRLKALPNISTAHLAIAHNARGDCLTITTACTSGTQAIGEAYRKIRYGICDIMLCGGSDAMVNPDGLIAFSALGVLSTNNEEYRTASRPFDKNRDGFMIGEGAAMFILESLEHCRNRGGQPLAEVAGYSSTSDAYRLTDEPPEAWGSIRAIQQTLQDANMIPSDIDYINAHGTGTRMNDKIESFAIKKVFGDHAYSLPISSTKSLIGHLVAAAGAVELAACVGALDQQLLPPTINYSEPDPDCDLDYITNEARHAEVDAILSNSFGFGGQNACLIIKRIDSPHLSRNNMGASR